MPTKYDRPLYVAMAVLCLALAAITFISAPTIEPFMGLSSNTSEVLMLVASCIFSYAAIASLLALCFTSYDEDVLYD